MKKGFITIALILGHFNLYSQNAGIVNIELAGVSGFTGLSYDNRFNESSKLGYKIALGYGFEFNKDQYHWYFSPVKAYMPINGKLNNSFSLPLNINYLFGKKSNYLETALGVCLFYADYNFGNNRSIGYYSFARVAYRYQASHKPFTCSAGLDFPFKTPGSGLGYSMAVCPSISIGYKLK